MNEAAFTILNFCGYATFYLVVTNIANFVVNKAIGGDDNMVMAWVSGMVMFATAMTIFKA